MMIHYILRKQNDSLYTKNKYKKYSIRKVESITCTLSGTIINIFFLRPQLEIINEVPTVLLYLLFIETLRYIKYFYKKI